jgi:hypothetical protein
VRLDALNEIGVADDLEIESPGECHAGLPRVFEPAVLLRVKGGMVEILKEKSRLFIKGFADRCRRFGESGEGIFVYSSLIVRTWLFVLPSAVS